MWPGGTGGSQKHVPVALKLLGQPREPPQVNRTMIGSSGVLLYFRGNVHSFTNVTWAVLGGWARAYCMAGCYHSAFKTLPIVAAATCLTSCLERCWQWSESRRSLHQKLAGGDFFFGATCNAPVDQEICSISPAHCLSMVWTVTSGRLFV
jgi:hypothetical protein